jgi:hypothetical protein
MRFLRALILIVGLLFRQPPVIEPEPVEPVIAPPPPPVEPPPVEEPEPSTGPIPTHPTWMFDISNFWLPGVVTDEEALQLMRDAKTEGWDGVAALALWPSLTHQQMWAATEAGLFADMYAFPVWPDHQTEWFEVQMRRVRKSWPAPCYVWVDLEDTDHGLDPEALEAHIDSFVGQLRVEGYFTGTYSSRYWLDTFLPGVDISKWGPFWLADPDGTPELEDWEPRNGIERPTWTQYKFNAPVGKMHTDYNVWTL